MNRPMARKWVLRWLYAGAIGHVLVGALLPWLVDAALFEPYHRGIEAAFWPGADGAPAAARAQQSWWIALFGPTVQSMALWMLALIRFGARQRDGAAWGWLIAGLVLWAPQDIAMSLRADCWPHVWLDCAALLALLPPLVWLWLTERRARPAVEAAAKAAVKSANAARAPTLHVHPGDNP
ncbi:MAG: cell division protein [Pseudomonadota bacterium]